MLIASAFSSFVNASQLNIYLWEDTLSSRVIDAWNKTHDTKINLYHFDNDDERSLLMLKSTELPFDIVVLDNVSAQLFSKGDIFEELSSLKANHNNQPRWQQACGKHSVPYFWGYVGIAYRKSKVPHPPTQWRELVDIDESMKGHVGLLQDSVETLLPALYSLGYSPVTDSVEELKAAYDKVQSSTPDILTFEYALSYVRSHPDHDNLYMSLSYSGDQFSLNRYLQSNDWDFALPEGKPYLWLDCLAINSYSTNKDQAKEFLEFLMRPDIAAINAQDIKSATPNQEALKLLSDSYLNDKAIILPESLLAQSIIDTELSPSNLSVRAKVIHNIIKHHEAQP